ncbi:MAG: hypothetical protein HY941_06820 [Gammaproteobacteria bacterium]|nr:hypothetical protein [Gammaproteobacteria bacterium]
MNARKIAASLITMVSASFEVQADAFYEAIQYKCDSNNGLIQIEWLGAYNEALRSLYGSKDGDSWNPWELTPPANQSGSTDANTIIKRCPLNGETYEVTIGALRCNDDPQGRNGAVVIGWSSIYKGEKLMAREQLGVCDPYTHFKGKLVDEIVTTKLIFRPGHHPTIERVPSGDFYR